MLYKTKMLTLLPLFNFVLFTLSPSSRGLLKVACTQGFHLDSQTTESWLNQFSAKCAKNKQPGSFAYIDSAKVQFHFESSSSSSSSSSQIKVASPNSTDDDDDDDDDYGSPKSSKKIKLSLSDTSTLEKRFAECFAGHERASTARAIFSVISKVLTSPRCTAFRPFDLSFAFAQRRSAAKLKRVSIVDYVDCLLDPAPTARADASHKALHRYLKSRCKLPKMFILNPNFVLPDDDLETSDESE